MNRKTETKDKSSSQIDRFREAARALECDEDETAFKAKLAVIARQKPKNEPKGGPCRSKREMSSE
jgi:hypothetical protein